MNRIWAGLLAACVAGAVQAQETMDLGAMMQALGGMAQSQQATNAPATVSPKALKEALPAAVPGFERVEAGSEKQGAFGMNTVVATGVYESGDKSIQIEITDIGGMGGLAAMAMLGWTRKPAAASNARPPARDSNPLKPMTGPTAPAKSKYMSAAGSA